MICSILLEKNYDVARFMYTRLGIPFYDFDKLIAPNDKLLSKSPRFYQLEDLIDNEIRKNRVYSQIEFEYQEIKKILKEIS